MLSAGFVDQLVTHVKTLSAKKTLFDLAGLES
jgi:hypothetical protein